ncbi:MAG: HAMP domain-containing protein, partial [Gammaproteobacteria bacterium]
MAFVILKRPPSGVILVFGLFVLLFGGLYLMSAVTQNSEQFSKLYSPLLAINAAALIALAVLISANLLRLMRQYREGIAGSRLTVRLVIMFVILSVLPVSIVFYFSIGFLHRGIDSWFDVRIEQALEDALELSRTSLEARTRELLNQTLVAADDLTNASDIDAAALLNDIRSRSSIDELTLLTQSGRIIASSEVDPTNMTPNKPNEAILLQLRQHRSYTGLDPIGDSGLHVRVVVNVPNDDVAAEERVLQALTPIAIRQSTLADSVQLAFAQYKKLSYLRTPLKYSFTITLSLVLALSLLSAVWAAFFSTRRLVAPIRDLAEGTRAVAAGDYDKRLPVTSNDELGFLVWSFNDMT